MLNKLDHWHKTRIGLLVFAVVELAITYGFFGLAIDRGNLWWYILTLIFLVGTLQNLVHLIFYGKGNHGRNIASKRN